MRTTDARMRLVMMICVTALAFLLGVVSDFVVDYTPVSSFDVVSGIIWSPLVVTVGGGVVGDGLVRDLFWVGGLVFWPFYILLAWSWLRFGRAWSLCLLGLWSVQGFMMIQHRVGLVMSV